MQVNELITALNFKLDVAGMKKFEVSLTSMKRMAISSTGVMGDAYKKFAYGSSKVWMDAQGRMRDENGRFVGKVKRDWMGLKASSKGIFNSIGKGFTHAIGNAGFNLLRDMGRQMVRGGGAVLKYGEEYEGMMAGLTTTLGGSSQKAAEAFARIEKFAVKTPYEMRDGMQAFMKLSNLGMDTSERVMTAYGDMASSMKLPYDKMIMAVERAAIGLDFRRSALFGITAKKQGDGIGEDEIEMSFRGVKKIIKRNKEDIEGYYRDIAETYFKGGMMRQMKTIGGILSNVSDSFAALGRHIWKDGFGDAAKSFGLWAIDTIQNVMKLADKHLPKLIDQAKNLAKVIIPIATKILHNIPWLLKEIGHWAIFAGIGIGLIVSHMIGLKTLMMGLQIVKFIQGFTLLGGAIGLIPIAIGLIVASLVWAGWEIYKFATTGKGLIADLAKEFPEFGQFVKDVGNLFNEWKPKIMEILETLKVMTIDGLIWMGKTGIDVLKYWIIPAILATVDTFKTLWNWGKWVFDNIMGAIGDMSQGFTDWKNNVKTMVDAVMEFLRPLQGMFNAIGDSVGAVWNKITGGGGGGGSGAGLADTAANLIKSGQMDRIARADGTGYWGKGVACAWSTKYVVSQAGVDQKVLDAMNPSAPDTYQNLLRQGLAKEIPFSQIKPGDLAWTGNTGHETMVGPNGTLFAASNDAGKQIGKGQRYIQQQNWIGAGGHYLRINPEHMTMPGIRQPQSNGQGNVTVPQTIHVHGNANASQMKQASFEGTAQALTNAGMSRPKAASPTR